jgi:hypothetical protein
MLLRRPKKLVAAVITSSADAVVTASCNVRPRCELTEAIFPGLPGA